MLHVVFICLSFALIVLMAGLFLLAYAKKEGLGKLTKFAAYVAIVFGTVAFLGGITAATLKASCCGKNRTECPMMSKCDKGGDACPMQSGHCDKGGDASMMGHCDKGMENCPMNNGHCDKGMENCPKSASGDMAGCKNDTLKKCCADKAAKK